MMRQLKSAFLVFIALTLLTGVIYPLAVTGIARLFFRDKAEGSLIYRNGTVVGSTLIGQRFTDPKYLWGRPSATSPDAYNAASSSGSNLATSNPDLKTMIEQRTAALRTAADPDTTAPVPVDLITASASGLDPDISPAAAYYQAERIAKARGLPRSAVEAVIARHTTKRLWGILGEPVVNVLEVNLELESYGTAESR
ncbi:MAG: potassium-transporting ATPase subunit KdpC [Deltaproteobacteria bacterium]